MAMVKCPKCGFLTKQAGYLPWQILVSIFLFPIGLMSLLLDRKPTVCAQCGTSFAICSRCGRTL